jgi:hypothetical protein
VGESAGKLAKEIDGCQNCKSRASRWGFSRQTIVGKYTFYQITCRGKVGAKFTSVNDTESSPFISIQRMIKLCSRKSDLVLFARHLNSIAQIDFNVPIPHVQYNVIHHVWV